MICLKKLSCAQIYVSNKIKNQNVLIFQDFNLIFSQCKQQHLGIDTFNSLTNFC